jgi:hypothetical protein
MSYLSREIVTESGEREFGVRFDREEGIGLLTTRDGKDYLILDSIEYWFDIVQESYPKKRSCVCKNKFFQVTFDYYRREGILDFRSVGLRIECSSCSKEKNLGTIDFRHSPTQELLDTPITYCSNPKLKCKVRSINGYWTSDDRHKFLKFMVDELGVVAQCWYWSSTRDERLLETIDDSNKERLLSNKIRYLGYYFSNDPVVLKTASVEGGIYVKNDPWRTNELLELAAPINMVLDKGVGSIHYIYFAEQFIDAGIVRDKSPQFVKLCGSVLKWLSESRVQLRGKNSFDSASEVDRLGLAKFRMK